MLRRRRSRSLRRRKFYNPNSRLRDIARFHMLFNGANVIDSKKSREYQPEDAYRGFLSSYYEQLAEEREAQDPYTAQLAYRSAEVYDGVTQLAREAQTMATEATTIFGRIFKNFDAEDDFSKETLYDFMSYLSSDRENRQEEAKLIPSFSYADRILDDLVDRELSSSVSASEQTREDLARFQDEAYATDSAINRITTGGGDRSRRLLDNLDYINKPGIFPAVALAAEARDELSIDIFQLQNKSVQDYYVTKLLQEATAFRDGKRDRPFVFNLRMAGFAGEQPNDLTTYDILGPNLIFQRKLERMQEMYGDAIQIRVDLADRKNHPKFMVSDDTAIIGTQNLTRPIGGSIFQAGSNYESLKIIHYKQDGYTPAELDAALKAGRIETNAVDAESLLFLQTRAVMQRSFNEPRKILSTGMANVAGPYETFQNLKGVLAYATQHRNTQASFMLDQVFLLQYEKELFSGVRAGEMGNESQDFLDKHAGGLNQKGQVYQGLQRQLLNLVIEGRAQVIVDSRNYKEKVQDPIFKRLTSAGLLQQYGYDPVRLVREMGKGADLVGRVRSLTEGLSLYGFGEDMAVQLLAMTSGNIQISANPRSHVKSYLLTQEGMPIAGDLNSSNYGFYSMAQVDDDREAQRVNAEMGLFYAAEKVRNFSLEKQPEGGYNLASTQETGKLMEFGTNFRQMQRDQGRREAGQMQYLNSAPDWHSSVDYKRLLELESSLLRINEMVGQDLLKVNRKYDDLGRPVEIAVAMDVQGATGTGARAFNLRFSALLNGAGGNDGFIYDVSQNRIIGGVEYVVDSDFALTTGLQRGGDKLTISPRSRITLNPQETTTAMVASLAQEVMNKTLIRGPYQEYQQRWANNPLGLQSAIVNYLTKLTGEPTATAVDLINPKAIRREALTRAAVLNMQSRLNRPDRVLDSVRELAGIDVNNDQRIAEINELVRAIDVFGRNRTEGRAALLIGGRDNLVNRFARMLDNPMYADLLYDVVAAQRDATYTGGLNKEIGEMVANLRGTFLTRTQATTYGYTQALRKRAVYGVTNEREQYINVVNAASNSEAQGIHRLSSLALLNSPHAFSATTNLRDGSPLYIPVAEGGGSREIKGTFPDAAFPNMLPYNTHQKVGDVVGLELIQDAAVGSIVGKGDIESYLNSMGSMGESMRPNLMAELEAYGGTAFIFNFDRMKKASQIPQRLKNVIGTRPLSDLTLDYQRLLDTMAPIEYKGARVTTSYELQAAYLQDLRIGLSNLTGQDRADLIGEEYGIGALYGNKIRRFLSAEVAAELEAVRLQLMNEFGLDREQTQTGIGAELLRTRLMRADISDASSMRGFTGSSERGGPAVMMVQLAGAYSDYYYANPTYGGDAGVRRGFVDKAVKGFQGSKVRAKLSVDALSKELGLDPWTFEKNLLAKSGEIASFNLGEGKTYIYRYNEETGEYEKNRPVDSRAQFAVVGNIIDRLDKTPSFAYISATSNAASLVGEDAREVLREVRILNPNLEKNEVEIELLYDRTLKEGTGRRSEAYGGLFKGVPIFVDGLFEGLGKRFGIEPARIQGVANPSNLKSYFYEHGATLLTHNNGELFKGVLERSNPRVLAAALLMGTGMSKEELDSDAGRKVLANLAKQAKENGIGQYFNNLYKATSIINRTSDLSAIGELMLKEISDDRGAIGLQAPSISNRYISLRELEAGLEGDLAFKEKLGGFFRYDGDEYLENNMRGREMSILAGTLDMYTNLATSEVEHFRVVDVASDNHAYMSLGAIAGLSVEELLERREELIPILQARADMTLMIPMYVGIAGSQAKVATSSRDKGRIEFQHIVADPFTAQIKSFQEGGSIPAMRKLMASILGSVVNMSGDQVLAGADGLKKAGIYDALDPYFRSNLFKSKMLGAYVTNTNPQQFSYLKKKYNLFSTLGMVANSMEVMSGDDSTNLLAILEKSKLAGPEIDRLKSLLRDGNVDAFKSAANLAIASTLREFDDLAREYKQMEDKSSSIEYAEAFSRGLTQSGLKRMAFSFPSMEISGGSISFNKDRPQMSIMLSGEDMRVRGQAFGGFESVESKALIDVAGAFIEGGEVSKFFDLISEMQERQGSVEVDLETAKAVGAFQEAAIRLPGLLVETSAGDRQSQIFGNKLAFDGGTFTAAAMFGIPDRAAVISQSIVDKHGGFAPQGRVKATETLERRLTGTTKRLGKLKQKLGLVPMPEEGQGPLTQVTNKRRQLLQQRGRIEQHRRLMIYQMSMLESGLGPVGTQQLTGLLAQSQIFQQQIESASDDTQLREIFDNIAAKYGEYKKVGASPSSGEGDYYAKLAALGEMQVLQYKALSKMSKRPDDYELYKARGEELLRTANFVEGGFVLGSKSGVRDNDRISIPGLEGEMRRHSNSMRGRLGLATGGGKLEGERLNFAIDEVRGAISAVKDAARKQQEQFMTELGKTFDMTALSKKFEQLDRRLTELDAEASKATSRSELEDTKLFLDSNVSRFFTEFALSKAQAFRSPPPGNLSLSYSKFNVLRVADLNRIIAEKGYSFTLNEERGQTAGIFNPLSFLVSQLGDFDGDSITAIFDYTAKLEVDLIGKRSRLNQRKQELGDLNVRLSTLVQGTHEYTQLQERIINLPGSINQIEADIRDTEGVIAQSKRTYDRGGFEEAARKWVANYAKVDERFFMSRDKGGFAKEDTPLPVLYTFIEQGRGLFGGMEDEVAKWKPAYDAMLTLGRSKEDLQTQERFDRLVASTDTGELAKYLRDNPEVRGEMRQVLIAAHDHQKGFGIGVAEYIGHLGATASSNKEAQKYLGKGLGVAMSGGNFDMMLKTLGEAGSVILGKTYNSMIGLLFTESPVLAISHAMEHTPELRDMFKEQFGEAELANMDANFKTARAYSEGMGGFLQVVNQLMRDSIKPKQSAEFFKQLEDELGNYQGAESDRERDQIINRIVEKFGPGSGLKGLVQLDSFIKNMGDLNKSHRDENAKREQASMLQERFGIGEQLEAEISDRLGFEQKSGYREYSSKSKLDLDLGQGGHVERTALVAAYKTKQDLLNLAVGFSYEKALAEDKVGPTSSGRTLLEQFRQGIQAPGAADMRGELTRYTKAANSFYQGNAQLTDFNREEREYIESVKVVYDSKAEKYLGMDETQKLFHAMIYTQTRNQMEPFAGRYGEGLIGLGRFNITRGESYGGDLRVSGEDWNYLKDGSIWTNLQAAANGKFTPANVAGMFQAMTESFKRNNPSATMGDVMVSMLSMGSLNGSAESQKATQQVIDLIRAKQGTADEAMYRATRQTGFGQLSSTMMEFVKVSVKEDYETRNIGDELVNTLVKAGASEEWAERYRTITNARVAEHNANPESTKLDELIRRHVQETRRGSVRASYPETRGSESILAKGLGKGTDIGVDALLIPALGLIGTAIATGNFSPDAMQGALGSMVTSLAYTRYGMLQGNEAHTRPLGALATFGAGMGFKVRGAIDEQEGDTGKGLAVLAMREAALVTTTAALTQPISNGVARMLGGRATLDFDRYESLRGVTSNVIGAVTATMLGMFLGETVQKAVFAPSPSMIETTLKAAQATAMEIQSAMGVSEEFEEVDLDIESSAGLVDYISYQSFGGDPETNSASYAALYGDDAFDLNADESTGGYALYN